MGSNEKVAGKIIAIATAGPTPGIAPIITPPHDPISSAIRTSQRNRISNAETIISISSPTKNLRS